MNILIYIKRPAPVMAAKAAIHAFFPQRHWEQKFFAELFFKKATACFL
jgi:hypothetical protein